MVVFQCIFYSEIYQDNIFFIFLKVIFDISALKWFKNTKTILILKKKLALIVLIGDSFYFIFIDVS
jgi:hypothetical protein